MESFWVQNDSIPVKLFIDISFFHLFIPASFILMYFPTLYPLYNVN